MVAKNNLLLALLAAAMFSSAPGRGAAQEVQLSTMDKLAGAIANDLKSFRSIVTPPMGAVVAVDGYTVYISNENDAKPRKGASLAIVREKEAITHPVTGEKLGMIADDVASVEVVSSDDKLITARMPGGADIRKGDRISEERGKPKAAVALDMDLNSLSVSGLYGRIKKALDKWEGVAIIQPDAVERFMYEEKITDRSSLADPAGRGSIKNGLKADYLIYLGVKEKPDAILSDVSLLDLSSGEKTGPRKSLTHKHAGDMSASVSHEEEGKAAAPEVKVEVKTQKAAGSTPQAFAFEMEVGEKARVVGGFNQRAVAILSYDLNKDGTNEIVIGFDHKIAIFKFDGSKLNLVWEKEAAARNQTIGLCAGDFDSDGRAEIYVNNLLGGRVNSYVLEPTGEGSFAVTRENEKYLFYAGEDGGLYAQNQTPDNSFGETILSLKRTGEGFSSEPFLKTPPRARLSGITIFDIDKDGVEDAAGFDYQYSLAYHPSSKGKWEKTPGRFGGSNMSITLSGYEDADTETYHVFQPPIAPLAGGRFKGLLVAKNIASMYITSGQKFTQSQLVTLEYDGMGYYEKKKTPVTTGVINAVTILNKAFPNIALVVKNEPSLFGSDFSEIILVDLDRY